MKNEITKDDFIGFEVTQEMAGEYGRGVNKKLEFVCDYTTTSIWYRIYNNKKVVGSSVDIYEAIAMYNEL